MNTSGEAADQVVRMTLNGVEVAAAYCRRLGGVLDEVVDTAASGSGLLLCPGYPRFLVLFSPCPVAVAGFPAAGSADVSFCFDLFRCEIRKKDGTAESVLRSGLKSVLNRLVYAGFGLPESI